MAEFEDAVDNVEKLTLNPDVQPSHENTNSGPSDNSNNSNESGHTSRTLHDNDAVSNTGGVGSSDEEYHTDEGGGPQSDSVEPKAKTKQEIKAEELRVREEKEATLSEEERVVSLTIRIESLLFFTPAWRLCTGR